MLELCGSRCSDLLDESPSEVRIVDTENGVRFVNALSLKVETPEDLLEAIVKAKKRKRDDFCHLVCQITILPPSDAPACIRTGTLALFDCAGTEQRRESQSEYRKEQASFAEVNASLRVLKECLSAKTVSTTTNRELPYSYSTLTRCLRASLEREDSTFHVVACISPKATDTEDTLDTLKTISHVGGDFAEDLSIQQTQTESSTGTSTEQDLPVSPKAWGRSELCDWLVRKHLVKAQDLAIIPPDVTGRSVMRMTKAELQKTFYSYSNQEKGDLLYRCLRAEVSKAVKLGMASSFASSSLMVSSCFPNLTSRLIVFRDWK